MPLFLASFFFLLNKDIKQITNQLTNRTKKDHAIEMVNHSGMHTVRLLKNQINHLYDDMQQLSEASNHKEKEMQTLMVMFTQGIRTPLSSINDDLSSMLEGHLDEENRQYLNTVSLSLKTMQTLVDNLFIYASLNNQDMEIEVETFEVYPVICEILATYYDDFNKKMIEPIIIFENESCVVQSNKDLFCCLVKNLVINGVKYGVDYFEIRESDGIISFENDIEDNQQIDVNRLFERFYSTKTSKNDQSIGLGLSIVKRIIELNEWGLRGIVDDQSLIIQISTKH